MKDVYFPGPGIFKKFWWLFFIPVLGVVLFIALRAVRTGEEQTREENSYPLDVEDEYSERLISSNDDIPYSEGDGSLPLSSGPRVTLRAKGVSDISLDEGSQTIVLSQNGRMPNQQVWDLDCSDQAIRLDGGQLYLNDSEIQGNQISLTNDQGEKVTIQINRD